MTGKAKEQRMLIYRMLADIEDESDLMQIYSFVHYRFLNQPERGKEEKMSKAQDEMIVRIYDNLDILKPEYSIDAPEARKAFEDVFDCLESLGVVKRNVCEKTSENVQRLILTSLSSQEKQGFVRGFKFATVLLGGGSWQRGQ